MLKIPTAIESAWIKNNCRKGWSEPTGHREWLHEYWQSADFATLSRVSQDNDAGIWWQRYKYKYFKQLRIIKLYNIKYSNKII